MQPLEPIGNSLRRNVTMSSTTRITCLNECLCGVCVMSMIKLIMLVVLVFNIQVMHIGGIVKVILSFLCYVVGAY